MGSVTGYNISGQ